MDISPHTAIKLPCGRTLPNRFVKAAMYEHLASFGGGPPKEQLIALYSKWGEGGWGMVTTGNVQVSSSHLTLGRDMCIPPSSPSRETDKDSFRRLASAMRGCRETQGPLAIMQLSHSGRQSPRFIGGRAPWVPPLAPSSIPVGYGVSKSFVAKVFYGILFPRPATMKELDIVRVIASFRDAAVFAQEMGFDGVQLHAAHGYLLSQFLSNRHKGHYNRYRDGIEVIMEIAQEIRSVVRSDFVLGIKLNSADYGSGSMSDSTASRHLHRIARGTFDFIEISGGDYESPEFASPSSPRQELFSNFSRQAMEIVRKATTEHTRPRIMLTGGLRRSSQFQSVLEERRCDLLGIGRAAILQPDLPLLDDVALGNDPSLMKFSWLPKLFGAGVGTSWYVVQMHRLSLSQGPNLSLGSLGAVWLMWLGFPSARLVVMTVAVGIIIALMVWHMNGLSE